MISNPCIYMDYRGGEHWMADSGYIWLYGYSASLGCCLGWMQALSVMIALLRPHMRLVALHEWTLPYLCNFTVTFSSKTGPVRRLRFGSNAQPKLTGKVMWIPHGYSTDCHFILRMDVTEAETEDRDLEIHFHQKMTSPLVAARDLVIFQCRRNRLPAGRLFPLSNIWPRFVNDY